MNIQIDAQKVVNNLLEQNKQLVLEVATLKAALEQLDSLFSQSESSVVDIDS